MDSVSGFISGTILLCCFVYTFFIRSKLEEKQQRSIFDNQVLGFIDALYLADIPLRCSLSTIQSYVKAQLSKAHALPGNQTLIEHTTPSGYTYHSHTCPNDHAQFSVLCLVQYAKETGNEKLLAWCNDNIVQASKLNIHF